jgi:septum site-determining protein MinD
VSTNKGLPVVHDSRSLAGEAFRRIAARIDGEDVPFLDLRDDGGLISRVKRMVGLGKEVSS